MPDNDHLEESDEEFGDDVDEEELDDEEFDEEFDDDAYGEPGLDIDSTRPLMVTSIVLQLVAVVLCVVAPFLNLWTLSARQTVLGGTTVSSLNGWGTYDFTSATHGPRLGVILAIAAVPLLLAAFVRLREVILLPARRADEDDDPPRWQTEPARASGVGGSALLLGGAATFALTALNVVSVQDASARAAGLSSPQVTIGAAVWLSLVAWVASAAAVVLSEVAHRRVRQGYEWSEEPV